jgi:hypothetical protein
LGIEPGTLALCFAYSTGQWGVAMRALSSIYAPSHSVWRHVNEIAKRELSTRDIPEDIQPFLKAVMGGVGPT